MKERKVKLRKTSRRWAVLNYAVSDPNEWSTKEIAEDMGDPYKYINEARLTLTKQGLIKLGEFKGRSRVILPTPKGVEVLYQSLEI